MVCFWPLRVPARTAFSFLSWPVPLAFRRGSHDHGFSSAIENRSGDYQRSKVFLYLVVEFFNLANDFYAVHQP
jgi:hypothetical protein